MQFKEKHKRKPLINLTSLIDVLFLLLIFFMVTSTFLEQPGIKLELPNAQSAEVVQQKDYTLFVDNNGKMFLNEEEVTLDNIEAKIIETLPEMKDEALILKADQEVSHGIVVQVMDLIKKGGVKKLVIGTKVQDFK